MILIGCLSIVSGVLVAALYHQRRSRPIPNWLRKLTRVPLSNVPVTNYTNLDLDMKLINETSDDKTSAKRMDNGVHNSHIENGIPVSNGNGVTSIAYPTSEDAKFPQQEESRLRNGIYDYRNDWRLVATSIDHLMLVVGVVVTISAVVVTAVLFVTSTDNDI